MVFNEKKKISHHRKNHLLLIKSNLIFPCSYKFNQSASVPNFSLTHIHMRITDANLLYKGDSEKNMYKTL